MCGYNRLFLFVANDLCSYGVAAGSEAFASSMTSAVEGIIVGYLIVLHGRLLTRFR